MSVAEIGLLHARYVRLSDRFKSLWTYHQFASGVFKNLIPAPLPYRIDFQSLYDRIKSASAVLNSSQVNEAAAAVGLCELALDRAAKQLLRADEQVSPSADSPYWLVSTRHPAELAAAIEGARPSARAGGATMG